jgi:hypothetical protein
MLEGILPGMTMHACPQGEVSQSVTTNDKGEKTSLMGQSNSIHCLSVTKDFASSSFFLRLLEEANNQKAKIQDQYCTTPLGSLTVRRYNCHTYSIY